MKWELYWKNGLLYKGQQLFLVPTSALIPILLHEFHSAPQAGHFGVFKTYRRLVSQFFWTRMKHDVQLFIKGCTVC